MNNRPVRVLLAGIGGYGENYLRALLDDDATKQLCALVAGVDPQPERCSLLSRLKASGIPVLSDLREALRQTKPELTVVASPIHLHCPQTVLALEHGSNVLCEKPLCAAIQDGLEMARAARRSGRFAAIGYQWSFSAAVQELKNNIRSGLFGRPLKLKTLSLSPRNARYYSRNGWAGAMRSGSGEWVLDSSANNAHAHYLHNMLYLLGPELEKSILPAQITAELYRANKITNCDTAAARIKTEAGIEILFYSSHAVPIESPLAAEYFFEKAVVKFDAALPGFVAELKDGQKKTYAFANSDEMKKLRDCALAVRSGAAPVCGVEAAAAHTLCINGMHESMPQPVEFPADILRASGAAAERVVYAEGLAEILKQCFLSEKLPSELGAPWSARGMEIALTGYSFFPRNKTIGA